MYEKAVITVPEPKADTPIEYGGMQPSSANQSILIPRDNPSSSTQHRSRSPFGNQNSLPQTFSSSSPSPLENQISRLSTQPLSRKSTSTSPNNPSSPLRKESNPSPSIPLAHTPQLRPVDQGQSFIITPLSEKHLPEIPQPSNGAPDAKQPDPPPVIKLQRPATVFLPSGGVFSRYPISNNTKVIEDFWNKFEQDEQRQITGVAQHEFAPWPAKEATRSYYYGTHKHGKWIGEERIAKETKGENLPSHWALLALKDEGFLRCFSQHYPKQFAIFRSSIERTIFYPTFPKEACIDHVKFQLDRKNKYNIQYPKMGENHNIRLGDCIQEQIEKANKDGNTSVANYLTTLRRNLIGKYEFSEKKVHSKNIPNVFNEFRVTHCCFAPFLFHPQKSSRENHFDFFAERPDLNNVPSYIEYLMKYFNEERPDNIVAMILSICLYDFREYNFGETIKYEKIRYQGNERIPYSGERRSEENVTQIEKVLHIVEEHTRYVILDMLAVAQHNGRQLLIMPPAGLGAFISGFTPLINEVYPEGTIIPEGRVAWLQDNIEQIIVQIMDEVFAEHFKENPNLRIIFCGKPEFLRKRLTIAKRQPYFYRSLSAFPDNFKLISGLDALHITYTAIQKGIKAAFINAGDHAWMFFLSRAKQKSEADKTLEPYTPGQAYQYQDLYSYTTDELSGMLTLLPIFGWDLLYKFNLLDQCVLQIATVT